MVAEMTFHMGGVGSFDGKSISYTMRQYEMFTKNMKRHLKWQAALAGARLK